LPYSLHNCIIQNTPNQITKLFTTSTKFLLAWSLIRCIQLLEYYFIWEQLFDHHIYALFIFHSSLLLLQIQFGACSIMRILLSLCLLRHLHRGLQNHLFINLKLLLLCLQLLWHSLWLLHWVLRRVTPLKRSLDLLGRFRGGLLVDITRLVVFVPRLRLRWSLFFNLGAFLVRAFVKMLLRALGFVRWCHFQRFVFKFFNFEFYC